MATSTAPPSDRAAAAQPPPKPSQPFEPPQPAQDTADATSPQGRSASAADADAAEEAHLAWSHHLPRWQRPSIAVVRLLASFSVLATGIVLPIAVELYDQLACEILLEAQCLAQHRPCASTVFPSAGSPPESSRLSSPAAALSVAPHLPYGPDNPVLCHSPPVLALSASLQMRITVATGLLAVLTTGWWSSRLDRLGRRGVLVWSSLGILVNSIVLVITIMTPRNRLPGGAHFLLLGAVAEGSVGGAPTSTAAFNSYISDITPPGTKALSYSLFLGLTFAAGAIAPIIGGWIVKAQGIASAFILSAIMTASYFVLVLLFVPESSSPSNLTYAQNQHMGRARHNKAQLDAKLASAPTIIHRFWAHVTFHTRQTLHPLHVLVPARRQRGTSAINQDAEAALPSSSSEDEVHETSSLFLPGGDSPHALAYGAVDTNDLPKAKALKAHLPVSYVPTWWSRDYNLLLLMVTTWLTSGLVGLSGSKFLYAQQRFQWGAPEIGEYMTATGLSRVLSMSLILPLAMKFLHRLGKDAPLHRPNQHTTEEDLASEHLSGEHASFSCSSPSRDGANKQGTVPPSDIERTYFVSHRSSEPRGLLASNARRHIEQLWTQRDKHLHLLHDSRFDLLVARASQLGMTICYVGLATASSAWIFTLWSCLTCLGAGIRATSASLSVALLQDPKDAGRLFGATSMLSAVMENVISPVIFTRVYQATADTPYSWSIFLVAAGLVGTSFPLLCVVRIRKPSSLPTLPLRPASKTVR